MRSDGTTEERSAAHAISRMPREVRDKVSRALEDGADWKAVRDICAAAGFPGVKPQNVTNYRQGEHERWKAREERMEALRRDSETTAEVVKFYVENGGSPAEAGLITAAEMMNRALSDLDPSTLKQLIADDPKAVLGIMRELRGLADLLRVKKVDAHNLAHAEAAPAGPVMTEEEQNARIVAAVDAALGLKSK
jgi:hypothetical protein